ncbi:MAG: AAA family ATPase [Candidatus Ozemobacteraceae bacterium]
MYYSRLLVPPSTSFFLFGCRGTGKSTWVSHVLPGAHVISLLNETHYQEYLASPALFRQELHAIKPGTWVFIDEIQRLPNLLNEVHSAIEERKLKFILCGSSARKLRRSGVNLLGGRALEKHLFPFLPQELKKNYDLETTLRFGTLPVIFTSDDKREQLEAYTQMYLKEEIQAEALVRNLPGFARFLPVAALFHGQTINVTNIARDAKVARTTAEGYLQILEDTLMVFFIHGYEANLRVKERKLPKLYWVDPGMVCGILRRWAPPEDAFRGALFEGLIATILKAMQSYNRDFCDEISYWAPGEAMDTEVDFLLRKGDEFIAIEVKSGATFRKDWTKGLRAIKNLKGLRRSIVVYPSGKKLRTDESMDVLPFNEFVQEIAENTLFP